MNAMPDQADLAAENHRLREALAEAESVLGAIRNGEIDAVVVSESGSEQVFTLKGADHPYRVLVESMSEGAATLSQSGLILYANPRLAKLLGTSKAELTGSHIYDWVGPGQEATLKHLVELSCQEPASDELVFLTSAGSQRPALASFSPLVLEGERFSCAIITDQRLARHHAALQETTQRLHEANERLLDADRRKDAFLATLAHELRNPLAPIRTAAYVIKELGYDDSRLEHAHQMIERQVTHLTRLVNDLLELSRITLGRFKLKQRPENLSDLLENIVDATRSWIKPTQQLNVEFSAEPMMMEVDSVRLSQAITNILENAIKYTPADGEITFRTQRVEDEAVIRVQDSGRGISADALPRIFEMFEQETRDDLQPPDGLGIGLALARSIVEMHDGTIEAHSAGRGFGSEFVIRLPLRGENAQASAGVRGRGVRKHAEQEVLIVDDNVDAAESLKLSLEMSGHRVKAVYGGNAALLAVQEILPDLILLDIGLPDMDGYEVARRLRARYGASCPTLIALSGWGRSEDKKRATQAGIDEHLTKPVDPAVLAELLEQNANRKPRSTSPPPLQLEP